MIATTRLGTLETIKRRDGSTLTVCTRPDGGTFRSLSVPLLPRHGVHLQISGTHLSELEDMHAKRIKGRKCAPGQNFARHFRYVWARLPLKVRRSLLRHWRRGHVIVELSTFGLGDFEAICGNYGRSLRFRPYDDWSPRGRLVYATIAHELAHTYRFAVGIHSNGLGPSTRAAMPRIFSSPR